MGSARSPELLTVAGLLSAGARYLAPSPVTQTPHLDAEVLLRHVLGWSRVELYRQLTSSVPASRAGRYRRLLRRRRAGWPVSYLVQRKEFMGLALFVDQRVLIPRPETEIMVEEAVAWWRRRAGAGSGPRMADVGVGSGAIAIAVAALLPEARVVAVDSSPAALEVAEMNARRHGVAERINFRLGDLLAPAPGLFDAILANLPYTRWRELPAGVRRFEPRGALAGGADGLDIYRRLLPQLGPRLARPGLAILEIDPRQALPLVEKARAALPGAAVRVIQDLSRTDRFVVIEVEP